MYKEEVKKTEAEMVADTVAETKILLTQMGFTTFPTDERIEELIVAGERKWREIKELVFSKEAAERLGVLLDPDKEENLEMNSHYLSYACKFTMSLTSLDDLAAKALIQSAIIQLTMECK